MRHLHVVRVLAALVGLSLAASFPAMAAKPSSTPAPPKEMKLESERRYTPDENQGQKGFWIEHEEYSYRYDPWPEQLIKAYETLFKSKPDLKPLIMAIHRKEKTLDQVLSQFKDLKDALSATDNNPYYHIGGGERSFVFQYVDFDLIDKHFGSAWIGTFEDKRPIVAGMYASKVPMSVYYPNLDINGLEVKRPITSSCFVEVSRIARVIEAMDAGIPMPTTSFKGCYLGPRLKNNYATNMSYSIALTRESLETKMRAIYQEAIRTNSKGKPYTSYSDIGLGAYIPVN